MVLVALPNTLALSPKAASEGPALASRAAPPATRLSSVRLLEACTRCSHQTCLPGRIASPAAVIVADKLAWQDAVPSATWTRPLEAC